MGGLEIVEQSLKENEHRSILKASMVDRKWWGNPEVRFPDSRARDIAIECGELVYVDIPNYYFTSPSDIRLDRNSQLLRPSAKRLLEETCEELDARLGYARYGIRLAVTSMYRGDQEQTDISLSDGWYRAAKVGTSSHAAGAAFDISVRSYYVQDVKSGEIKGVNSWNDVLFREYQPLLFEVLGSILSERAFHEYCNLIVENKVEGDDYFPTCFHVCVSPYCR